MNHQIKTLCFTVFIYSAIGFNSKAQQAGDIDLNFGTNGFNSIDINGLDDQLEKLSVTDENQILCAGKTQVGLFSYDILTTKQIANGELDNTFGVGGIVTRPLSSTNDGGTNVFKLNNGKILAIGFTTVAGNSDYALLLSDENGNDEVTYGDNGLLTVDVEGLGNVPGASTFFETDLLIAGNLGDSISLSKMDGYSTLDASFGESGHITYNFTVNEDFVADLKVKEDGSMFIVGYTGSGASSDGFIARIDTDGALVFSFGNSGFLNLGVSNSYDVAIAIELLPDGRIIVVGSAWNSNSSSEIFALRLISDGSYDNTFGTNGVARFDIGTGHDYANSMLLQPDGKIIIGGSANDGNDDNFCLLRLNEDGSLDPTFGNNGIVITEISEGYDAIADMELQADGKLVVGGTANINGNDDIVVARYHTGLNISVDEIDEKPLFSVYPNPVSNLLTIKAERKLEEFELLDALGRTVLSQSIRNTLTQIDASNLASGIYLLQATDGKTLFSQRIIKE